MAPKFDIFLACAPKDYLKIPYTITSISENIEGYDKIFICSPTVIPAEITSKFPVMYYTYLDENGLPGVNRAGWNFRPNWCFQQHLKLFQQMTGDWYLTIDCDIIINRPMKFFDGNKPIYYRGENQYYAPYFKFMEIMVRLMKESPRSYIADMNLINRNIINDMLSKNSYTRESFIKKSQQITERNCHIGEPELYGNYCKKFFPDCYIEKDLVQAPFIGRHQNRVEGTVYSIDEIEKAIAENKGKPFDVFSLHSWLNEGDQN